MTLPVMPHFYANLNRYLHLLRSEVVYSTSHHMLSKLYQMYGKTKVDTMLERYWRISTW